MKSITARALAEVIAEGLRRAPPEADLPELDTEGNPLMMARQLYEHTAKTIASLDTRSPRLNPARTEARALLKLINALEKNKQAEETPNEAARRLRREDGETRKRVMQYVERYESTAQEPREDAPHGSCVHCESPLSEEQAKRMYG